MLTSLREAGTSQAYTSVWIAFLDPETQAITKQSNTLCKTDITFSKEYMTDDRIRAYIETGEPFGKAGGFGIQG